MSFNVHSGALAAHAGHQFFVPADYDIMELQCLLCNNLPETWSAHKNSPTGVLLSAHRNHKLMCDGKQVVCEGDGIVIALDPAGRK